MISSGDFKFQFRIYAMRCMYEPMYIHIYIYNALCIGYEWQFIGDGQANNYSLFFNSRGRLKCSSLYFTCLLYLTLRAFHDVNLLDYLLTSVHVIISFFPGPVNSFLKSEVILTNFCTSAARAKILHVLAIPNVESIPRCKFARLFAHVCSCHYIILPGAGK